MIKHIGCLIGLLLMAGMLSNCSSTTPQKLYVKGKQAYLQRNYQKSVSYLVKAAERNDPQAQYALGYMFYYGQGVPQDTLAAQYWIEQSAKRGFPPATIALHEFQQANYALPPMDRSGQVTFSPVPLDMSSTPTPSDTGTKQPPRNCKTKSKPIPSNALLPILPFPNYLKKSNQASTTALSKPIMNDAFQN